MVEFFQKVGTQLKKFFSNLSAGRKTALVITLVAVTIFIISVLFWVGDTAYQVLGTNFTAEDSTNIMRILREKKIPFKVDNDGRTIKIPPDAIYDLRLELATMGLPQSSVVGYEVFDKQSFGQTSFVQKINQKRALEGELMRTINNLRGVKRSRVHLALPSKSTFVEDQKKSTASVVLDIEPGVQLSEKQISGISHLVMSAVEGMELSDVTVVDAHGKLLSKNNNDPVARQTAAMLEYQQRLEQEYEQRVGDILSRVVGEGKVVAKVSLDLDFTQQQETQTQYDQEGAAIKSQQKENHLMDGSRPVATGAPGAQSNLPGAQIQTPEVKSNTQKAFETTNYAVPQKVVRTNKQLGAIKRISVAVLVDGQYVKDPAKPDEVGKYQPWSEEKVAEFRTIIASSLGADVKRDTIEIKNMEFRHADLQDAESQIAAFERRKLMLNLVQYLVLGLSIIGFFMFVVRPFIKWLTDNTVENMDSFLPKTLEELEKMKADDSVPEMDDVMPVIVDKVDPEKVEGEMIKEKIVTLVEGNPSKAALILHDWVHAVNKPNPMIDPGKAAGAKK